jgi:plastocyanin
LKTVNKYLISLSSLLLFVLAFIAIPACAADTASIAPQIIITEPMNGSEIAEGSVIVSVDVKNFTLVDKLGKPSVAGEGHIHYFMDAKAATMKTMSVENVTIDLVAQGMNFNTSTITVPAGAHVTINFDNQDAGIPHNFALYEKQDDKTTIFKGDVISGPKKIIYTFDAPAKAGTYFFRCDVHPRNMIGDFIVK